MQYDLESPANNCLCTNKYPSWVNTQGKKHICDRLVHVCYSSLSTCYMQDLNQLQPAVCFRLQLYGTHWNFGSLYPSPLFRKGPFPLAHGAVQEEACSQAQHFSAPHKGLRTGCKRSMVSVFVLRSLGNFHKVQSWSLQHTPDTAFCFRRFIASCAITGILEKYVLEQDVKSSNSVKVRKILAELQQESRLLNTIWGRRFCLIGTLLILCLSSSCSSRNLSKTMYTKGRLSF